MLIQKEKTFRRDYWREYVTNHPYIFAGPILSHHINTVCKDFASPATINPLDSYPSRPVFLKKNSLKASRFHHTSILLHINILR